MDNLIELVVDKGFGEKKILISDEIISLDETKSTSFNGENTRPSMVVFVANGNFCAPFSKGSRVLTELRESSDFEYNDWKLVFKCSQDENDFFKFPFLQDLDKSDDKDWGVWFSEGQEEINKPSLLVLNFPLFLYQNPIKKGNISSKEIGEILSFLYRTILSGVNAVLSFNLGQLTSSNSRIIAFSDIGNNLIDRDLNEDVYKLRIRVFTEVLSEWISSSVYYDKTYVYFGKSMNKKLIEVAWDEQADLSKDAKVEYGESLEIRVKNTEFLKRLKSKDLPQSLASYIEMSITTFSIDLPSLSADIIQCRTLVEALAFEICKKHQLKTESSNLIAYIERLEKSGKISPWITSYFHVIRLLGNEVAHYKMEIKRRPERPEGRDLIVLHGALNRILSFFMDEY